MFRRADQNFTLTADSASYIDTGTAVTLTPALVAASAVYTDTAQSVTLTSALVAASATYMDSATGGCAIGFDGGRQRQLCLTRARTPR